MLIVLVVTLLSVAAVQGNNSAPGKYHGKETFISFKQVEIQLRTRQQYCVVVGVALQICATALSQRYCLRTQIIAAQRQFY